MQRMAYFGITDKRGMDAGEGDLEQFDLRSMYYEERYTRPLQSLTGDVRLPRRFISPLLIREVRMLEKEEYMERCSKV